MSSPQMMTLFGGSVSARLAAAEVSIIAIAIIAVILGQAQFVLCLHGRATEISSEKVCLNKACRNCFVRAAVDMR